MIIQALLFVAQSPDIAAPPSDDAPFTLDLRLVSGESRRDVASAQKPLAPFVQDGGAVVTWRTTLPRSEGAITLVLRPRVLADESSRDRLWVDVNRDAVEAPEEVLVLDRRDDAQPYVFQSLADLGLPMEVMIYEREQEPRATAITHYHFACDLEIDGERQHIIVLDKDLDGRASPGDSFVALSRQQLDFIHLPSMLFASNLAHEPWYFGERVLLLDLMGEPSATLAPAPRPRHEFLAARAARINARVFEDYERERDSFFASYDIEPDRTVDPAPPRWYHAWDLDEAVALANTQGKPLWVEFTSDGCPWCKRYDWLNDRDAEVTERLRKFTLVKIARDLDPDQTAKKLGMDGVPCHALFDSAGESHFQAFGWVPPSDYVQRLDDALDAWARAQGSGAR